MNDKLIAGIVAELTPALEGRMMGKVWQLSRVSLVIDFRLSDGSYLFISIDPAQPRIYAIARAVRELEKMSLAPSNFVQAMRKHLGGARLVSLIKDEGERIVRFAFASYDAIGDAHDWTLVAQLTGRAANLLLLDASGRIVDALRTPRGEGQEIADIYQPPPRGSSSGATGKPTPAPPFSQGGHASLSAAADAYYRELERARAFDARAAAERARLRALVEKQTKLRRNLERDLRAHGDAGEHKRVGDLLLANIANAERRGSRVLVTDYFAEGAPVVELEIDEHASRAGDRCASDGTRRRTRRARTSPHGTGDDHRRARRGRARIVRQFGARRKGGSREGLAGGRRGAARREIASDEGSNQGRRDARGRAPLSFVGQLRNTRRARG
jgi:predicted ribosome quality control (RQC) complex YloA/Tae2 family protein